MDARRGQKYCSRKCRQAAWRLTRYGREKAPLSSGPGLPVGARFAYADPPYPGKAHYYQDQPSYAGEVDHAELVASLRAGGYAGWALSTSREALRDVLQLCPPEAHVCPWVKPIGAPRGTYGLHSTWEPLIVVGGRKCRPGLNDWLSAKPARLGGSDLIGRKPLAFCAFLFDALGMLPGDVFVDLFPGTGVVGRAWSALSLRSSTTERPPPSRLEERQRMLPLVSPGSVGDAGVWGA